MREVANLLRSAEAEGVAAQFGPEALVALADLLDRSADIRTTILMLQEIEAPTRVLSAFEQEDRLLAALAEWA